MKTFPLLFVLSGAGLASFGSAAVLLRAFAYVACGLLAFDVAMVGALLAAQRRLRRTLVRHRTHPARHAAIVWPAQGGPADDRP